MNLICQKKEWMNQILFSMIIYTITFTIVYRQVFMGSDYRTHMIQASQIYRGKVLEYFLNTNSYFMWHLLVKIFYKVISMPMEYASAVVTGLVNVITYLITAESLRRYRIAGSEIIAFIVMLVGPLYVPWFNENYYLGQYTPNSWHNPTVIMVRPFAIVCFFMGNDFLQRIREGECVSVKNQAIFTLLLLLSVFAKPSFIQGFLPAFIIYTVFQYLTGKFQYGKRYIRLLVSFIPAVVLMGYQYLMYFGDKGGEIGWLEVASHYSPNVWISLFISLLFPILYLGINIKQIWKRSDLQFSVCYFAVSWFEGALLYENNRRKWHGNFGWALQLSLYIFWLVIIACFMKDIGSTDMKNRRIVLKNTVLTVVLALHVLCGSWYAYSMMITEGMKF